MITKQKFIQTNPCVVGRRRRRLNRTGIDDLVIDFFAQTAFSTWLIPSSKIAKHVSISREAACTCEKWGKKLLEKKRQFSDGFLFLLTL